jgi:hypothetical protein
MMVPAAKNRYYRGLFAVAALYDIVLGVAFLFFPRESFELVGAEAEYPEYTAYITLIAVFLLVLGIGYALIARGNLMRNRDLIAVGTLYKLAYVGAAVFYLITGDYPHISFIAIFGVADLGFLVLMAECWWYIHRLEHRPYVPESPAELFSSTSEWTEDL